MLIIIVLCSSFLIHLSSASTTATTTPLYNRTDYILLDCGSSSTTPSGFDRNWQGDANSTYLPSDAETISTASPASSQDPSIPQTVPYMTARIFRSKFTYTFPLLSAGPKFIRLYFYPSTYSSLNTTDSFFSVMVNNYYTLLSNFSAFLAVSYPKPVSPPTLIKEYIVHTNDDHQLNITFLPSPNSYAFVNGIELVSIPDKLYYPGNDVQITLVGQTNGLLNIHNDQAFETVHRLNVGGREVQVTEDTGMFRAWYQDSDYVGVPGLTVHGDDVKVNYTLDAPPYTAPEIVYTTMRFMNYNFSLYYNMTWYFSVDSGFYYLVRLHFCELLTIITKWDEMVFTIFIRNQTAELNADVSYWGNGRYVAIKRDYITYVADPDSQRSKQDLWLAMHPNVHANPAYFNALLNGLEIFKLSRPHGSLAAPNPSPVAIPTSTQRSTLHEGNKSKRWLLTLAVAGGSFLMISFVSFLVFRWRKWIIDSSIIATKFLWDPLCGKLRSSKTTRSSSALPSDLCRHFSLQEIKSATGNFDGNLVIGIGGFGKVYKGYIGNGATEVAENGATEVAIKRLNPSSDQGVHEFITEISMLSKLRHVNLVSLIGYSDDDGEMILVYNYMARGTLRDHLYRTENPPLPWKQRLQICIDAAKGLHYLHTSAKRTIIHRDIKSTNILLDEKWVAKVSDFGLSKAGAIVGAGTHVSTVVKGTLGYLDPEYYRRQQLTEKSDVYSFGVVLFEVLCARPAISHNVSEEQVNLVRWARCCYKDGTLDQIVDPNIKDEIATECLHKYIGIAYSCSKDKGIERPTMQDVVWSLEFALKLQEAAEDKGSMMMMNASDEYTAIPDFSKILQGYVDMTFGSEEATSSNGGNFNIASGGFKSPEAVFTEIMNPFPR